MPPKKSRPPESLDAPLPRLRSRRVPRPTQLFVDDDEGEPSQPSQETQPVREPSPSLEPSSLPPRKVNPTYPESSLSSQPSNPQAEKLPTPQIPAASSNTQRAQRLDSLKKRPNLPKPHGNSSTGLKFQPKPSIARRTKEEREAREQAEEERKRSQHVAQGINPTISSRGGRALARGVGRGVSFSGGLTHRNNRTGVGQASGLFSGPTINEVSQRGRGGRRGDGNISGNTHTAAKPELSPERARKKTSDSKTVSGRTKGTSVKKEEISSSVIASDFESEDDEKRIDVKEISHVILIEDSDEGKATSKSKEHQISRPPLWAIRPVRLEREEHVERSNTVNTDASLPVSGVSQQKSKHKYGKVTDSERERGHEKSIDKAKAMSRDVEFLRHKKVWKGAYQDGEDADDEPRVKEEPKLDEAFSIVAVPDSITNDSGPRHVRENLDDTVAGSLSAKADVDKTNPTGADDAYGSDTVRGSPSATTPMHLKKTKRKPKTFSRRAPVFQSEEDRQEWDRYLQDSNLVAQELEQRPVVNFAEGDADGDASANSKEASPRTRRDELIYMFQLPPTIPNLLDPNNPRKTTENPEKEQPKTLELSKAQVKPASSNTHIASSKNPQVTAPSSPKSKDPATKVEPAAINKDSKQKLPNSSIVRSVNATPIPAGFAGYLTTYKAGQTILSWGGIEYEVGRLGTEMLQNCVMLGKNIGEKNEWKSNAVPNGKEKEGVLGGLKVKGLGLVQGGFRAIVEWNRILGK
ncbi:MAG: hypothetical protein MMC33_007233 [Icmadophila ericetorum]|nr:hypothetical protein [Icmadophila ericetorum]